MIWESFHKLSLRGKGYADRIELTSCTLFRTCLVFFCLPTMHLVLKFGNGCWQVEKMLHCSCNWAFAKQKHAVRTNGGLLRPRTHQPKTTQIITNASEITWNATQQHILTYFCLDLFHIFKIAHSGAQASKISKQPSSRC